MSASIPSFAIKKEDSITLNISTTQATLNNQGYTYNQAGLTYNQAGVQYGGVIKVNQDTQPLFASIDTEQRIDIFILQTQAILEDQGYSYNQAGFTYNQIGVMYGGVSQQNQDIAPLFATAYQVNPQIENIIDIYTTKPQPATNPSMGVGWFMYILRG